MLASEPKHVNYILNKIENFNMEKLFFLFKSEILFMKILQKKNIKNYWSHSINIVYCLTYS